MATNARTHSVLWRRQWASKDENAGAEEWKAAGERKKEKGKWESDKKAIAREPPSAAAIFHYTALKLRRQSSIFSHPRIAAPPTPPKAIITPQFFTVLCHGENEPQYLSAQCIHKWVRRRTCRYAYTVYVSVCAKKPQTNAKNGHGQWWCSK